MRKDFWKKPFKSVLSALYWTFFFVATTCTATAMCVLYWFVGRIDPQKRFMHKCSRLTAYFTFGVNPLWRRSFEGLDALRSLSPGARIYVANHQSLADVLVLSKIPATYKWVAKAELKRMLGVGWLVQLNEYITVSHHDLKSVRRLLRDGKNWLRQGVSLFIFPEGRRSPTGKLVEFKDGPFRIACDTATKIIPIAIDGTGAVLPMGSFLVNFKAEVRVRVLPEVDPADFNYDTAAVRTFVRDQIAKALQDMRGETDVNREVSAPTDTQSLLVPVERN